MSRRYMSAGACMDQRRRGNTELIGKRNRENIIVFICYRPPKRVEKDGRAVPDGD